MSSQNNQAPQPGSVPQQPPFQGVNPANQNSLIGKHSLHSMYLVFRMIQSVGFLILMFFVFGGSILGAIADSASGLGGLILVLVAFGALVVLLCAGVLAFFSWKAFSWTLTEKELHIQSGIIFKHSEHVPLTRIHSMDLSAGLIQRVLGFVTLKVITASSASNARTIIPAMRLAEAEQFKSQVFAMRHALEQSTAAHKVVGAQSFPAPTTSAVNVAAPAPTTPAFNVAAPAPTSSGSFSQEGSADIAVGAARMTAEARGFFAGQQGDQSVVDFEYHMPSKTILAFAFTDSTALYGVFSLLALILGVPTFLGINAEQQLFSAIGALGIAGAIVASLFFGAFLWVVTGLGLAVKHAGFTVRRRSNRVEAEHGLIQRNYIGVSLNRVQSVEVTQGLICRMIGYAHLYVDTVAAVGEDGKQVQKTVMIHPFIKLSKVNEFLTEILPEFANRPVADQALPKRAIRRYIFRGWLYPAIGLGLTLAGLYALLAASDTAVTMSPLFGIFAVLIFLVFFGLWGFGLYKNRSFGLDGDTIAIRKGFMTTKTVYISRKKVQFIGVSQTIFQRRAKVNLGTIHIHTAAGGQGIGTTVSLTDVAMEDIDKIFAWAWPPISK